MQPPLPQAADFVALDFETADRGADSACSLAMVRVVNGTVSDRREHLIRPPRRSFEFTWVHGITWEHVARCDPFEKVWPKFTSIFQGASFFVAHNAPFDRRVLHACCASAGFPPPELSFLCSMQMARKTWGIRPTSLPNVCRHLGITLQHHQALSDAEACARITMAAFREKPSLAAGISRAERRGLRVCGKTSRKFLTSRRDFL